MRIHRKCLVVFDNRLIELPFLQQKLSIRIVRIGIVGNQQNIFLEGLLGVGILFTLPVRIAKLIVRCGKIRRDFSGLLEMLDRSIQILNREIVSSQRKLSSFIVGVLVDRFFEIILLLDGI